MRKRNLGLVAAVLIGAGLLSACTARNGADRSQPTSVPVEPSTSVSVEPSTSAPVEADDCHLFNESVDTPPLTVALLDRFTDSVVIAEVTTIEEGVWNTKDGAKPERAMGPGFNPGIQTPIRLQVIETIRGAQGPGTLVVVNPGGSVGCDVHTVDNAAHVTRGETYAFFLQPSPDADGGRRPDLPQILVAFPIAPDGSVATEYDGVLSHDEFVALVEHPVPPTATPEPSPAEPGNPG